MSHDLISYQRAKLTAELNTLKEEFSAYLAESCGGPCTTKVNWIKICHMRDETLSECQALIGAKQQQIYEFEHFVANASESELAERIAVIAAEKKASEIQNLQKQLEYVDYRISNVNAKIVEHRKELHIAYENQQKYLRQRAELQEQLDSY